MYSEIMLIPQLMLIIIMIIYFISQMGSQKGQRHTVELDATAQHEKLKEQRKICLSEPLSEKTRPSQFSDIIGQDDGIFSLKAALCGANPQHILIYGPPGVGKTCAARLVLEEAKMSAGSPFKKDAPFIEMDATCIRFDERSIADPLIGSVHDPIYQGAGAFGQAGVPQPKPGAVTKAHGGVLFLDEIGELHPTQLNKLLKVLEDRRVFLESAYYSSEDKRIPEYIHDVFKNGLPADFRLVGATTRSPEEIPPAVRSRCIEVFFRSLTSRELTQIASNAAKKGGKAIEPAAAERAAHFSANGRDAVNIVQLACGIAEQKGTDIITANEIDWIAYTGRYAQRPDTKVGTGAAVGRVNGLAVAGSIGMMLEIEAVAAPGSGRVCVTGFAETEESGGSERRISRKSTARSSIDNVMCVLKNVFGMDLSRYDIHINIPGGMPVDGPSAGIAIWASLYSAISGKPVPCEAALTGEISLTGAVKPVGGVKAKLEAAGEAGVKLAFIPKANAAEAARIRNLTVIPVENILEVQEVLFRSEQKSLHSIV